MRIWVRRKVYEWIFAFVRSYFMGKVAFYSVRVGDRSRVVELGKVAGAVILRDHNKIPVDLLFFISCPGSGLSDLRRFSLTQVKRDPAIGWVFHD